MRDLCYIQREWLTIAQEWLAARKDRIKACYTTRLPDKRLFIIIPASETFDFDLADEETDLVQLMCDGTGYYCEVQQVPGGDLSSFIDVRSALLIFGADSAGEQDAAIAEREATRCAYNELLEAGRHWADGCGHRPVHGDGCAECALLCVILAHGINADANRNRHATEKDKPIVS